VSRYRDQAGAALRAVRILSPARYAWLGRASRPPSPQIRAGMGERELREHLVASVREELYASFYRHGRPVPARWGESEPVAPDPWLADALSRANRGRGSWEPGWRIARLQAAEAVVTSARLRARVAPSDCRPCDGDLRPGSPVEVRLPKELPALSPGFHTVLADAGAPAPATAPLVRVYWNVGYAGAPALVAALSSRLNGEHVPFRLKIADHPLRLDRCDAAVLYLPGDALAGLEPALLRIAAALMPRLRPLVPAFTLPLAPGVALAEERGAAESFGERRCALLADAIVRIHERGIEPLGAQVDAVAERFAEDGIRLDAPYREPSPGGRHVL
jgi:HopA1 effector protein family